MHRLDQALPGNVGHTFTDGCACRVCPRGDEFAALLHSAR